MRKQNIIIYVIVGILCIALLISLSLLQRTPTNLPNEPESMDAKLKIVSQAQLYSWTDKGAIVILDDSSTFAQLKVFIPRSSIGNEYTVGDYLNIYHNGVIKDGSIAEFQKIYKIEFYQMPSNALYNEWEIHTIVDTSHTLFVDTLWPAIQQSYAGDANTLTPISVLAASRSHNPVYAILCSANYGGDRNALLVYYVQVVDGETNILLSEHLLAGLHRLIGE